ncbi:MAG: hypothetical protein GY729_19520 [Desulfobacteraceae bacterium]|nr:hypothetical protein [Desulfobacteraceae bacterium]
MNDYLKAMSGILLFNIRVLHKIKQKRIQLYCIINVTILGLIYGIFAFSFSQTLLIEKGVDPSSFNAFKIIFAGIPVAFLMHGGASLFIWVFLKAIGGKNDFLGAYFHMGIAAIALWPAAPFAAAFQIGIFQPTILWLAIITVCYGIGVNFAVIKNAYQLTRLKMVIASTVSTAYIGCFLYLWL